MERPLQSPSHMARKNIVFALCLGGLFATSACMTSAPERESTAASMPLVSSIELSRSVGSVGQKFHSDVSLHSRRLGNAEVSVRSLPPGLRFDEKTMAITGVPTADGFFSVTIAVRKKRDKGIHFTTPHGAWFSERLDIDIYEPIDDAGDSEDLAMNY